jgi:hypothetical protein
MNEQFTVEEVNLMCVYDTNSRWGLIDALTDAMTSYGDEELFELAVRVADKLSTMSDADFAELNLCPEYSDDETEVNP